MGGAAQAQADIVAATYNLRYQTPADGPNAWPHRRAAVLALLRYHEIELLGTQEALVEQVEDLETLPGFQRVGVGRDDGVRAGEHTAIFFRRDRFELLASGTFWLSETPDRPSRGWDGRCCHRIATWARLRERPSGRVLLALSTHFDHEGEVARHESARLLLRRLPEMADGAPVVVLGDFNATPASAPLRLLHGALHDARAISETPPYGPEGTFNGFRIDAPLDARIDHVLLSPGWRVLRYAALTDQHQGRYPSDHLPVVVRLRWPP